MPCYAALSHTAASHVLTDHWCQFRKLRCCIRLRSSRRGFDSRRLHSVSVVSCDREGICDLLGRGIISRGLFFLGGANLRLIIAWIRRCVLQRPRRGNSLTSRKRHIMQRICSAFAAPAACDIIDPEIPRICQISTLGWNCARHDTFDRDRAISRERLSDERYRRVIPQVPLDFSRFTSVFWSLQAVPT